MTQPTIDLLHRSKLNMIHASIFLAQEPDWAYRATVGLVKWLRLVGRLPR